MDSMSAQNLIDQLQLKPHPEGGHYKRLFASPVMVETAKGPRPTMTAIYYLLERGHFSAWHRLASHELWHWHSGGTLRIHRIDATGKLTTTRLGPDGTLTLAIAPNIWFAAELTEDAAYALASCTVTPGFDFDDFELAEREQLAAAYPKHQLLINKLTRF